MTGVTQQSAAQNREIDTMSSRRRWAGMAVLALSLLVVVMDMTILNVAMPEISTAVQPTSVQQLWIIDVYSLVVAGLLVTASAAGDRWGRRRMLMAGYGVFGFASAIVLVADTPNQLIAVRALLGVGGAMIMPSTLSMIRSLFPDPRERAKALGVWGATAAVGSALGPIVGGFLLEHFSWHSAFLVNVPVMVLALVGATLLLPATKALRPPPFDVPGTALSIVGMVGLVYAIKTFAKDGLAPAAFIAAAVAVVALPWFVRRCLTRPEPMLQIRLFRSRGMSAGVLTVLATTIAMSAVLYLGAQWLQVVDGRSPLGAGIALLPAAVGGLIGSPLAPVLAARFGARSVLSGGLFIGGLGFALLFVAPDALPYPWVAVAFGLVGLGTGTLAVASAVIMAGTPREYAGSAAAIEETTYEVGGALGVAVLGSVAAAIYRSDLPVVDLARLGVPAQDIEPARESISGAGAIAEQMGSAGSGLVDFAGAAFTDAFAWTGLLGGLTMLAMGLAVHLMTPKDLSITDVEH